MDTPRDGFDGDVQGSRPREDSHRVRPVIIEHDHGKAESRELPRWKKYDDYRDREPDFERHRSPHGPGSSQERFRTTDSRLDGREDMRGGRSQDNWRDTNYPETRRSPMRQDRPNSMRFGSGSDRYRGGPMRGRGGPRPPRGRMNHGRGGPPRNQQRFQQSSQGYQDVPHEEQRPGHRPFRQDCFEDPAQGEPSWAEQWEDDRETSLDRHLPSHPDLDPKMPRQRERTWNVQKTNNMTAAVDETLTIKVDMSRHFNQKR